ncbi:hypothetical protein [Actinomycetospora sp. NBRC 106378]|nr:hypothetical protein [Actinomycetospora sp. NBRC 106378]GLZ53426.1 hypothetical protein Acsp07_30430 [Actinomycetospora sp. NBRC 106378]
MTTTEKAVENGRDANTPGSGNALITQNLARGEVEPGLRRPGERPDLPSW